MNIAIIVLLICIIIIQFYVGVMNNFHKEQLVYMLEVIEKILRKSTGESRKGTILWTRTKN